MKTIFRISLFVASLSILLISACEPSDNTAGSDPRDPYIGVWQFVENSKSTDGQNFIVNITKDPQNTSQVILENFVGSGAGVVIYGLVTSSQIVVSSQKMSNGWTIEGSGIFSNKTKTSMSWDYSLLIAVDLEHHTATATLQ